MLVNTDLVFKGLGLRSARIALVFRLPCDEIGEERMGRGNGKVTIGGKGRLGRGCRGHEKGEGIDEDIRMEKGIR